ncbi:ribose transport system substrate-binding protein [Aequitasia blattaphilus]|uniref:Sugar ABC transporter substrate-binding protein n=1 Tax=Aequitasia blattaphilus TaxID=2949332 RepID=A0ABT1EC84_9FIRM|nr:sugar ABC transporter substrate-binding protein [Aequitasia blattaphilus]MCP1102112.1 sugar ABC transporter substrate-binding protein [Aequitasia blattaphilus]MCR8614752.1 sugar ABC transporter substrate-binding protein [Aequitasia blattaphilus]
MKRKVLAALLTVMMVFTMMVGCGAKEGDSVDTTSEKTETKDAGDGIKIGLAIQTLGNQVWAQQMDAIQKAAEDDGNSVTVVESNENANTQISQIENFITSGCDVIVVNPVDPDAIEDACKKAREAGIKVLAWDEEMENTDINWIIKNYDLGFSIGEGAAEFIKEKFGDKECEVAVLGYPQTPILLERENGILDALKENAPNAKVVANQPAINPTEGLNAMETILQANPDVKVVCCIGGGGAAGANEAFKGAYGSDVPEDVGIFSTDLTDETVASMENGEFNRMCVAITGNPYVCGEVVYDLAVKLADGEEMEQNVYRDLIPVTIDNLKDMIAE